MDVAIRKPWWWLLPKLHLMRLLSIINHLVLGVIQNLLFLRVDIPASHVLVDLTIGKPWQWRLLRLHLRLLSIPYLRVQCDEHCGYIGRGLCFLYLLMLLRMKCMLVLVEDHGLVVSAIRKHWPHLLRHGLVVLAIRKLWWHLLRLLRIPCRGWL